jgi:hypothetical protein
VTGQNEYSVGFVYEYRARNDPKKTDTEICGQAEYRRRRDH